jgi:hypothetical protein
MRDLKYDIRIEKILNVTSVGFPAFFLAAMMMKNKYQIIFE